jgi:hypothetical protein
VAVGTSDVDFAMLNGAGTQMKIIDVIGAGLIIVGILMTALSFFAVCRPL